MPGYGFSGKPTATGWDAVRIARAWIALMKRLGYARFVAQGGDWGAVVTDMMGVEAPPELLGIHSNMPATVPPEVALALQAGDPPLASLSAEEKRAYEELAFIYRHLGYATPDGHAAADLDRPRGFAGRPGRVLIDHDVRSYELIARVFDGRSEGPHARRRPRQHHAVLADQHRDLVGAALLGEQAPFLQRQERRHPRRAQRLSRRAL